MILIIVANYYLYGMRRTAMAFREATGNYKNDWYSPIIEAIINVCISIILAKNIGIAGVFLGTIISSLCTNFWLEPLVVCKKSLTISLKDYLKQYFKYALVTITSMCLIGGIFQFFKAYTLINFIIKMIILTIIPNIIIIILYFKNDNYKYFKIMFKDKMLNVFKRQK